MRNYTFIVTHVDGAGITFTARMTSSEAARVRGLLDTVMREGSLLTEEAGPITRRVVRRLARTEGPGSSAARYIREHGFGG